MKIAFYVGSFDEWHDGHDDVVTKALNIFDKVVIMQMSNPGKMPPKSLEKQFSEDTEGLVFKLHNNAVYIDRHNMSIIQAVGNFVLANGTNNDYALIRGLRNEKDFCEEQILTYWYEDLGIKMPILHFISDRKLVHLSSSAMKAARQYTEK